MCKFQIGDIVKFKDESEELKGQEFVVTDIYHFDGEEEIGLRDYEEYTFMSKDLELVKRCPYKNGDRVSLKYVYWNSERQDFLVEDTIGTVDNGYIEFDRRSMDCFHVPVTKLGYFWSSEDNGNDYDVVFCLPTEEEVKKAKQIWLDIIEERIKEMEEEFNELKTSREEIKKQIG